MLPVFNMKISNSIPSCFIPLDGIENELLSLALPLLFLITLVFNSFLMLLYRVIKGRCGIGAVAVAPQADGSASKSVQYNGLLPSLGHTAGKEPLRAQTHRRSCFRSVFTILIFTYASVTSAVLAILIPTTIEGQTYVYRYPTVQYDPNSRRFMLWFAIAIAATVFVVIGLPFLILFATFYIIDVNRDQGV
jgi:hypothetical protein